MKSCVCLRQFPDQLILFVKFLVPVGILIQFKDRSFQSPHKRLFFLLCFCGGRVVYRFGLSDLYAAPDQCIINPDLDALSVYPDINMMFLRADRIKGRRRNLFHDPMTIRNFVKGKTAILPGRHSKQGIFFHKVLRLRPEKPDHCSGQFRRIAAVFCLPVLSAINTSADQLIWNRAALIHCDLYDSCILSGIFKIHRVLRIREHISIVRCPLFYIVTAERKIRCKRCSIASIFSL